MQSHILLISYVFPPYPGIGGRRWAKFAKYLAKKGYMVHVICAKNPFKEISAWTKDVDHPNIKCYFLPPKYPAILLQQPKTVFEKLSYRFYDKVLPLIVKGNKYDRGIFWKDILIDTSKKLIEEFDIKNVIATGGPFRLLYYTTELKKIVKDINLIIDYRDQWTDNQSFFGYSGLNSSRLEFEKTIERETIERADNVITVAEEMTLSAKRKTANLSTRFLTIHNGFDPDDIEIADREKVVCSDKLTFVFTGNLYNNLDYIFIPFLDALKKLKNENEHLYQLIQFEFYGVQPDRYKELVKAANLECVQFHGSIPLIDVYKKINRSHACMLFLNHDHTFSLSTKFFEYISLKKQVLVFSELGELSKYVDSNRIGYSITPANFYNDLAKAIELIKLGETFNPEFNIDQFSVPFLLSKLEEILG